MMESSHDSLRNDPSTNSGEGGKQFSSEEKQGLSFSPYTSESTSQEDKSHFKPNATSKTNSENPFGETNRSQLGNNSSPSSSSSSSQNPFQMPSDASNTTRVAATESGNMHNQVPTSTTSKTSVGESGSQKIVENHDQGNDSHHKLPDMEQEDSRMASPETRTHHSPDAHDQTHGSSSQQLNDTTDKNHEADDIPKNVESNHTFSQGHHGMASRNLRTDNVDAVGEASASKADTKAPRKLEKDSQLASEPSDDNNDDNPVISIPKHGQQSSDVAKQNSSVAVVPETKNGSQTQNPPTQVMKRPEDPAPATSSPYRIPLHVFATNKSSNQWSNASNESLFSIQMGNSSFSNDMGLMSKSGEFDKPGDMNVSDSFSSNQPSIPPQHQHTKFNDISQSTAQQHEGSTVTEEKAAETMREVIWESVKSTKSKSKGDLTTADGSIRFNKLSKSNDHSFRSDGSTKSFAFKVTTDGDKITSKGVEEKRKQQKLPEQQSFQETSNSAQNPNSSSTPNASQNRWLSCFACCN